MKSLLLVVCIGLLFPAELDAITCYQCSGDDCNNILKTLFWNTCTTVGYCMKTKVGESISRSCAPICIPAHSKENGVFCCGEDKCNSGVKITTNISMLLLPLIAMFLAKRHF